MDISVVIPLLNEEESLQELYDWIAKVMQSNQFLYEVIFIDDGSTDSSWEIIKRISQSHNQVKGIRFQRNYGKSQALHAGFKKASGDVVITMDADLQDNPEEIPELYRMVTQDNYDLVSGWKKKVGRWPVESCVAAFLVVSKQRLFRACRITLPSQSKTGGSSRLIFLWSSGYALTHRPLGSGTELTLQSHIEWFVSRRKRSNRLRVKVNRVPRSSRRTVSSKFRVNVDEKG